MRIRIGSALLVLLLSPLLVTANTATAQQDASCDGIDDYIAELTVAGEQLEASALNDEADLDSWTSEEFTAASDAIEAAIEDFEAIDPPAIAEEYHTLLLQQFELLAQMFDTMASTGAFGALLYIEPMNALSAEADTVTQAIEDACGVDIENEFSPDDGATPVAVEIDGAPSSPVAGPGEEPTGIADGTREHPIPVGQRAQLGDDWQVMVIAVTPDATDQVMQESSFNEPPAPGHQFFIVTLRVTYTGDDSDDFSTWNLGAVGQTAIGYNAFDDDCGTIPDELSNREIFPGGTIEGNLCWSIASEDANSLVLYDTYEDDGDRIYLSLMPSEIDLATPVATDLERR
jgi:hypothetical protein